MNVQVNGWVLLVLVVILAFSYGFSYVNMNMMAPAISAQIGANTQLVTQVNQAFANQNKQLDVRLTKIETQVETIKNMK